MLWYIYKSTEIVKLKPWSESSIYQMKKPWWKASTIKWIRQKTVLELQVTVDESEHSDKNEDKITKLWMKHRNH